MGWLMMSAISFRILRERCRTYGTQACWVGVHSAGLKPGGTKSAVHTALGQVSYRQTYPPPSTSQCRRHDKSCNSGF